MGATLGTILFTLIITTVIGILSFNWRMNGHKTQAAELEGKWLNFESAIANKNIELINSIGLELAYNVHLTKFQLEKMSQTINSLINIHPEFEKLRLAILNKQLQYSGQGGW